MTAQVGSVRYAASPAMTAAAALAVVCASTALSGVIGGSSWLAYVVVAAIVVAGTGLALRAFRTPPVLVAIVELFVLLCLIVVLFTRSGIIGIFPGPQALSDIGTVLAQSMDEVRNGVPPVEADSPILCLVVVAIGLVTVAVDALAVTARVPAAAGLVLLCVYAVPASLDDSMLPWWSFLVGAGSFTLLLAVDGVHRHQTWRGKLGLPAAATSGVAPAAIAVTGVAVIIALLVGSTFTIIGTVGRLPGDDSIGGGGTGRLGIEPFTTLRGMLQEKGTTELFDVRGLPANPPYLQLVTLSQYVPNKGWEPDTSMPYGFPANAQLPGQTGDTWSEGQGTTVSIDSVNWEDVWLPVFGVPQRLQGVSSDYHYDPASGVVYSQHPQHPPTYSETGQLAEPTADQLRGAGTDFSGIDQKYRQIGRNDVSQRVRDLAEQLTGNAPDEFDKAQAIWRYFTDPANGYTYSTSTAPAATSDALVDFLFNGKTGYCEQYATAMGVLLRTLGLPVRVAIGFTDGYQSGDHRTITSQDAHAWDQVYFPGYGWVTFDPTPLGDGRTHVPTYLSTNGGGTSNPGGIGKNNPAHEGGGTTVSPTTSPKPPAPNLAAGGPHAAPAGSSVPSWQVWLLSVVVLLAAAATILASRTRPGGGPPSRLRELHPLWVGAAAFGWGFAVLFASTLLSWWLTALLIVLGIAAAPSVIRELRRRRRWRSIIGGSPDAAGAAWAEILAESWDRGTVIPDSETVRVAAHRMVREHDLDDEGRESLRSLVGAVERSWYSARSQPDPTVGPAFDALCRSLRRNAPLALRAKLLPRSVLRPTRARGSER